MVTTWYTGNLKSDVTTFYFALKSSTFFGEQLSVLLEQV